MDSALPKFIRSERALPFSVFCRACSSWRISIVPGKIRSIVDVLVIGLIDLKNNLLVVNSFKFRREMTFNFCVGYPEVEHRSSGTRGGGFQGGAPPTAHRHYLIAPTPTIFHEKSGINSNASKNGRKLTAASKRPGNPAVHSPWSCCPNTCVAYLLPKPAASLWRCRRLGRRLEFGDKKTSRDLESTRWSSP